MCTYNNIAKTLKHTFSANRISCYGHGFADTINAELCTDTQILPAHLQRKQFTVRFLIPLKHSQAYKDWQTHDHAHLSGVPEGIL